LLRCLSDVNTHNLTVVTHLLHLKQTLTNALRELQTAPAMQLVETARTPMEALLARVEQDTLEMEHIAWVGIVCS